LELVLVDLEARTPAAHRHGEGEIVEEPLLILGEELRVARRQPVPRGIELRDQGMKLRPLPCPPLRPHRRREADEETDEDRGPCPETRTARPAPLLPPPASAQPRRPPPPPPGPPPAPPPRPPPPRAPPPPPPRPPPPP